MKYELEVIAFNTASCKIAQESGADRIELCANPHEGGTTPSYGMIAESRKATFIQLFPIIRPRGGDFLYTDEEFQSMLHDIEICKNLNCDGIVIGMLNTDGNIDMDRSSKLMKAAGSMQVTFHRAFDRVKDPFNALEQIISLGCKRILTSGLKPNVNEGADLLSELVHAAGDRIIIMPGSGVRADNIVQLAETTGAWAFHSSARKLIDSEMIHTNIKMSESLQQVSLDGDEVRKIKNNLDLHFNK
jgi:copper homeostasis protein